MVDLQTLQENVRRTGLTTEEVIAGVQRISIADDIEYRNPRQARAEVEALRIRVQVLEYQYYKLDTMSPADFALRYYSRYWREWFRQTAVKLIKRIQEFPA